MIKKILLFSALVILSSSHCEQINNSANNNNVVNIQHNQSKKNNDYANGNIDNNNSQNLNDISSNTIQSNNNRANYNNVQNDNNININGQNNISHNNEPSNSAVQNNNTRQNNITDNINLNNRVNIYDDGLQSNNGKNIKQNIINNNNNIYNEINGSDKLNENNILNSNRKDENNMLNNNNFNKELFENANDLNKLQNNRENKLINVRSIKTKFAKDIWIVDKDSKTISFSIIFKNEGKRSFANKPGLLGLVLSNLLEGTKTKNGEKIKEIIENKSINISIHEDYDNIIIKISCLNKYFHEIIDLLSDLLSNATFPKDKVKVSKEAIILQLTQSKFNPTALANEKLDSIVLSKPYQLNIDETIQKIQKYTDTDIKECYKQIFDRKDAVITIVGNINIDESNKNALNDELNKLHDALKGHSNAFDPGQQTTELESYDTAHVHVTLNNPQSTVLFALPGVSRKDSDKIAIRAANSIFGKGGLGSRLFKTVRDQNGLVYHIVTTLAEMDLQSMVNGLALTRPENVNKVIDEVKKQVTILYENGISEEELHDFKINKCASYIFSTNASLLSFIENIREDGIKLEQVNDYLDKYLNLTRKDINNALKKVFDPKKLVFVSCGQPIGNNDDKKNNTESVPLSTTEDNIEKKQGEKNNISQDKDNNIKYDVNNQINIKEAVLENGMKVIVAPLNTNNSVCFGVGYYVGSADDPRSVRGISHFIEHMMFKQTKTLKTGEIKHYLDKYNKYTNAFTAYDITFYTHQCNKSFLELDMQIEADRMVNIQFDPKEIELEKGAIIEERKMRFESDPSMRYAYETVLKSLYLYSPYSDPVIGYMDQIIACNAENLKEHYDKYYMPNNAFALFVGDIDIDEAVTLCNKYFGNISRGQDIVKNRIIDPEKTGIQQKITHKSEQLTTTNLSIYYKIPHDKIKTMKQYLTCSMAMRILSSGMSSILYKKLVEEDKVLHSISADIDVSPYDISVLSINAILQDGQDIYNVEKEINKLINEFKKDKLTKELFDVEKQKYIDSFDLLLDNPIQLNQHIIFNICFGYSLDEIRNIKNILNTITFDDVKSAANDLFNINNQALVLYQMPEINQTQSKVKNENKTDNKNKKQTNSKNKHKEKA